MPRYPLSNDDNIGNSTITFTRLKAFTPSRNTSSVDDYINQVETQSAFINPGTGEQLVPDNENSVRMYVPTGLVFPDGSSYSNTELGLMGAATASITRGRAGEDLASIIGDLGSQEAGALLKRGLVTAAAGGVTSLAGRLFGNSTEGAVAGVVGAASVQQGVNFGTGRIFNPNTKSLFQGVNIRSFSFQFQMIPQSPEEASEIASIIKVFRRYVYPERSVGSITIKYPDKWMIEINPGPDNTNPEHQIKFKPAFLTSMSTSYNPTASMYHSGGAPVESVITLNFTEAETLDQEDIVAGF